MRCYTGHFVIHDAHLLLDGNLCNLPKNKQEKGNSKNNSNENKNKKKSNNNKNNKNDTTGETW